MNYCNASAPARPVGRTLAAIAAGSTKKLGRIAVLTAAVAVGLQIACGSLAFAKRRSRPRKSRPHLPRRQRQRRRPKRRRKATNSSSRCS